MPLTSCYSRMKSIRNDSVTIKHIIQAALLLMQGSRLIYPFDEEFTRLCRFLLQRLKNLSSQNLKRGSRINHRNAMAEGWGLGRKNGHGHTCDHVTILSDSKFRL